MKYLLLALFALPLLSGCGKAVAAPAVEEKPKCSCSSKLVPSKTAWFNGGLCPAKDKEGNNYKAQGAANNAQGYYVVGCFTESIDHKCECKP